MIIKSKTKIVDFEGKEVLIEKEPLFLKTVLINTLNSRIEGSDLTIEQSVNAYRICLELTCKEEVNLTAEDVVLIKARLNKLYTPLVVGQVVEILEPKVKEKK